VSSLPIQLVATQVFAKVVLTSNGIMDGKWSKHLMSKLNGPSLRNSIDFDCNAARLPTMQAMPRPLQARSSLVRRLVQAQDDPGKQRIRAWLRELDDKHLSNLGLTFEDIAVLRDTQTSSSRGRRAMARQTAALAATPVRYSGSIRAAWPARDEEEEEAGQ